MKGGVVVGPLMATHSLTSFLANVYNHGSQNEIIYAEVLEPIEDLTLVSCYQVV